MPRTAGATTATFEVKKIAIRMLEEGMHMNDVARILHRSRYAIWKWRRDYKKLGDEGLKRKAVPGRPRKLNDAQLRELMFYLAKGAPAYGFKTDVWTLKRIAYVIKKEFGVTYHQGHVWKLLQRLGFTHQKPERRAIERDDEEVERWRKRVWPQYRRRADEKGTTMVFMDESGRSETPTVIATWAPKGQPPVLHHLFNWERCSIISAITPRGGLHYKIYLGTVKSQQVIAFLKHLMRWNRGRIILFWDGGPIHRSKKVKDFLHTNSNKIEMRPLPPYAPDVNPAEQVPRRIKYVETANICPRDATDLLRGTRVALERIRRQPHLIQSFFVHAGLPLNMQSKLIN